MKKLQFKRNLEDTDVIERLAFRWYPTQKGVYLKTINGEEFFSSKEFILWSVEDK